MTTQLSIPLRGPSGERVDLWRTLVSHGIASLAPMELDEDERRLTVTVPLDGNRPRTLVVAAGDDDHAAITVLGRRPSEPARRSIEAVVARMLRLEEDLSAFYERAARDRHLAWVTLGSGRMLQAPTVFEDVVKTICTTNCTWALTTRMVEALVRNLGEPAVDAPDDSWRGRAFPTPEAMAAPDERFYTDVVRAGYRSKYLRTLAQRVAAGDVDLEGWAAASREELSDDELDRRLQSLPGVGPYASAHIMMLMGRHSRLILDSWTRPTYARLTRRRRADDGVIERRFRRYGNYAGLAFWLFLTRDWVEESVAKQAGAVSGNR